jgi:S-adenosylmethionine synthetase
VFDGTNPPYEVDARPNPLNFYGKTKLGGEIAVLEECPSSIILRVPVLYGKCIENSESAVNMLIDVVKSRKETKMDNFQPRYPTNVGDVAKALKAMIELLPTRGMNGVYHFTAKQQMTKYQMCQRFSEILAVPMNHITPISTAPVESVATRPHDCNLSTKHLENIGIAIDCVDFDIWFRGYLAT